MRNLVFAATALLAAACSGAQAQEPIGTSGGPDVPFKGCILFEHINFGGAKFTIRGNTDLSYIGSRWNDKVSSIACNPYCGVTVFEHRDFKGASWKVGANIQYVGDRWNDKISSAKVRCSR
jgi:Peptidase inhibitor family I36